MSKVCSCGKGYVSKWDGKCGKCRTKKEQLAHVWALTRLSQSHTPAEYAMERYIYLRQEAL